MRTGNLDTFFMFVKETNKMCLKKYPSGESLFLTSELMSGTYGIDLYLTFEYRIKVNESLVKTNMTNLCKELTPFADCVSQKTPLEDKIKKQQEIQIILKNYSNKVDEEKNISRERLKKIIHIFSNHEGSEEIPIPFLIIQKINKEVDVFKRSQQQAKRHTI